MWRFKPFMPKEQSGLEGRTLDIGKLKLQVRNMIAEGGFSTVFLARDLSHASKHYALKHMICNDEESLQLVIKEISVMKSLKGHPNIVTLLADTMFDMGRTKEAILVMEYCEKSLVTVLENRGAAYFDEKQILTIFRDICNAVFAMHNQSPPIAHRDLKAENLLLGSDGLWKLCDFGSTSTNHKVFEKPEEMGIEEDNIRKHTTPAYRSPEMWDLYRREVINEKVDIWALGCLLFRICYLKSAFDGESKLQILNGNYKIPELPKYSSSITNLIKDMLQSSPNSRPDISQVWFRVNGLLPDGLQKSLPDNSKQGSTKTSPIIQRSPQKTRINTEPVSHNPMGAFWSTEHANDRVTKEEIVKVSPVRGEKNVLESEISKLKDELAQVKMEKAEITSKYEKLSAICKSQRLEIQELKQAAKTPLITKESSPQPREKIEGTVWELEQNMVSAENNNNNNNNNNKQWEAFTDDTTKAKSVRTRNSVIKQGTEVNLGTWGFGSDDDFRAVPTTSGRVNVPGGELRGGNNSQTRKTESMTASQPAGWAGF